MTNTHETDPSLPSSFQSEGHLVNSPIRGVVTDESAKHRLGITARELDLAFSEKVLPRLEMVSLPFPLVKCSECVEEWDEARRTEWLTLTFDDENRLKSREKRKTSQ